MKRRTELKRSKPLVARVGLVTRTELRRTEIAAKSAKRARADRVRTAVLRPLRETQTWCAKCGVSGVGLDAHELLSRARGGSTTDLSNIVLLCRPCHTWVTENPTAAEAEGWALSAFGGAA